MPALSTPARSPQLFDAYAAEVDDLRAKMATESVGKGQSVNLRALKSLRGAAVLGIFNGAGHGTTIVVTQAGLQALTASIYQVGVKGGA